MIPLESDEWKGIAGSAGGDGTMTAAMLKQLYASNSVDAWAELHHQVNHQFTVGETAYAAAPHMVEIAKRADIQIRSLVLSTLASVVAARQAYGGPPIRSEWRAEYEKACADARRLVGESLATPVASTDDSWALLEAAAAFQGHPDLALILATQPEASCPECGEYIRFGKSES